MNASDARESDRVPRPAMKHRYEGASREAVVMRPVKRIGRRKAELYCPCCGRKRNVCKCKDARDG